MRTALVFPLLGLAACANVRPAGPSDYDRVNAWAEAHAPVTVYLDGQEPVKAQALRLARDTTRYTALRRSVLLAVPTAQFVRVEAPDFVRGRLVGAGVGVAAGLAMGGAMALPINNASSDWSTGRKVATVAFFAVSGGVLGYLVGQRTGVTSGFRLR